LGTDDDPIQAQLEPLPDPASPEDFNASDKVHINPAKESKPVPNPADIQHVLSSKPTFC